MKKKIEEQAENLGDFITEVKEIELIYINNLAYQNYLKLQGIDPELIINEPDYRSFLESKGVKFLTKEMLIEQEKVLELKQEQEKAEKLENFIKEGKEIELKFINDPAYLGFLGFQGVDVGRINEPDYRSFLESKGVKFKFSEEFVISNHSIIESEDQSSTLIGSDNIQED